MQLFCFLWYLCRMFYNKKNIWSQLTFSGMGGWVEPKTPFWSFAWQIGSGPCPLQGRDIHYLHDYRYLHYSVRMCEIADQIKLQIRTLLTNCSLCNIFLSTFLCKETGLCFWIIFRWSSRSIFLWVWIISRKIQ